MSNTNRTNIAAKSPRYSKQRQSILQVFKCNSGHLSAEEVYHLVKKYQPRISLGTIYRNLEVLAELGEICRATFAQGKTRYELSAEEHHHHLICLECGQIEDIPGCPMVRNIEHFIYQKNFEPLHHYFEIYGRCAQCRL